MRLEGPQTHLNRRWVAMTRWCNAAVTKATRVGGVAFCTLLLSIPALAQGATATAATGQAQVTFYSNGSVWKGGLITDKHGAFLAGRLFDGDHRLALLELGHFVTFNLPPGTHVFSLNGAFAHHPDKHRHLAINLEANRHYFLGAYLVTTHMVVMNDVLEEASCLDAQKGNLNAQPLDPKHLGKEGIPLAVSETSFPDCP